MAGLLPFQGVKNSERGAAGGVITEGNSTTSVKVFMDLELAITANAIPPFIAMHILGNNARKLAYA